MCFHNLPVDFDATGRPTLRDSSPNPYAYQPRALDRSQIEALVKRNAHVKDVNIDPVTRVAGALAFHAVVDLQARKVEDAHAMATLFRGYEIILRGRDPRDAIFIS